MGTEAVIGRAPAPAAAFGRIPGEMTVELNRDPVTREWRARLHFLPAAGGPGYFGPSLVIEQVHGVGVHRDHMDEENQDGPAWKAIAGALVNIMCATDQFIWEG